MTVMYALWLYRLNESEVVQVCERLNFNLAMRQIILEASQLSCVLDRWPDHAKPSELVACLDELQDGTLLTAWLAEYGNRDARQALDLYFREWRKIQPHSDGQKLRELGLAPGPAYKSILWQLRAAWLDGEIQDAEEERSLLADLLEDQILGV
jgi:tRNA nucleotidyltransferase (CCA-adding enzyme)